jgi:hypothetical protein
MNAPEPDMGDAADQSIFWPLVAVASSFAVGLAVGLFVCKKPSKTT